MNLGTVVIVTAFVLFVVAGFYVFPLMLDVFVTLQAKIGNENVWMVKFLRTHRREVVLGLRLMMLVGLALAIPAMIEDGFFTPTP